MAVRAMVVEAMEVVARAKVAAARAVEAMATVTVEMWAVQEGSGKLNRPARKGKRSCNRHERYYCPVHFRRPHKPQLNSKLCTLPCCTVHNRTHKKVNARSGRHGRLCVCSMQE